MTPIEYLDQQVKQACPNAQGVSIGRWEDKRTWRATGIPDDQAYDAERQAAQGIFGAFDKASYEASRPSVKTLEERVTALEASKV